MPVDGVANEALQLEDLAACRDLDRQEILRGYSLLTTACGQDNSLDRIELGRRVVPLGRGEHPVGLQSTDLERVLRLPRRLGRRLRNTLEGRQPDAVDEHVAADDVGLSHVLAHKLGAAEGHESEHHEGGGSEMAEVATVASQDRQRDHDHEHRGEERGLQASLGQWIAGFGRTHQCRAQDRPDTSALSSQNARNGNAGGCGCVQIPDQSERREHRGGENPPRGRVARNLLFEILIAGDRHRPQGVETGETNGHQRPGHH